MNLFRYLPSLTRRARRSGFWLAMLNLALGRVIPFNRPHGFKIVAIGDDYVRTSAASKGRNHNHLRGIHACAIATIAEFSAGFLLLTRLDPSQYRLIMSRLELEYIYQAKEDIIAESRMTGEELQNNVVSPLTTQESVEVTVASVIRDVAGNDIALARSSWQIKRWDTVRTKV